LLFTCNEVDGSKLGVWGMGGWGFGMDVSEARQLSE